MAEGLIQDIFTALHRSIGLLWCVDLDEDAELVRVFFVFFRYFFVFLLF